MKKVAEGSWCCCAIRVSVDVLYAKHDCALLISPVTSYSGVERGSTAALSKFDILGFAPLPPISVVRASSTA